MANKTYTVAKKYKFPKGHTVQDVLEMRFYNNTLTISEIKEQHVYPVCDSRKDWFVIDIVKTDRTSDNVVIVTLGKI